MSQLITGQVYLFASYFEPLGFLECNGAVLGVSDYKELYSVIGTTYGGDGRTTFCVPKMDPLTAENTGPVPYPVKYFIVHGLKQD